MRRWVLVAVALAVLIVAAGCRVQPDGSLQPYSHADTWAAVDRFWPEPWLKPKVTCIINRESGGDPYAGLGKHKYHGAGQIDSTNAGYLGSARQAAAELGQPGYYSLFDPYVNVRVMRMIFDRRAALGLDPWSQWSTAGGC